MRWANRDLAAIAIATVRLIQCYFLNIPMTALSHEETNLVLQMKEDWWQSENTFG